MLNVEEALRYLGVRGPVPDGLRGQAEDMAAQLTARITPRFVYRVFPLLREGERLSLSGTGIVLPGRTAGTLLAQCDQAVLLACTLGSGFDAMLRAEQARDMARAVLLDACGSAWGGAGCDAAEARLQGRLPGR